MTIPPSILPNNFSVTTVAEISCDKFVSGGQRYKKLKLFEGKKMQHFDYGFYKNINFTGFLPLMRNRKSVVIPREFNVVPKVPVVGFSKNETNFDRSMITLEGMVTNEEKLYIKRIFLTSAVCCQRTKEKKRVDNEKRGVGLFSQ